MSAEVSCDIVCDCCRAAKYQHASILIANRTGRTKGGGGVRHARDAAKLLGWRRKMVLAANGHRVPVDLCPNKACDLNDGDEIWFTVQS